MTNNNRFIIYYNFKTLFFIVNKQRKNKERETLLPHSSFAFVLKSSYRLIRIFNNKLFTDVFGKSTPFVFFGSSFIMVGA